MTFTTDTTLAEIATKQPAATRLFNDLGLDFCCGGSRPLAEACAERDLDAAAILADVSALETRDDTDWTKAPLPALISHILERFHEGHRRDLPELVAMARKVESVHAERPDRPVGLADHLAMIARSMEEHMRKEEDVLFPLIRAGRGPMAGMPVRIMMEEHEDHGRNLARMRELAGDYVAPADACTTWRALLGRLHELEREVMEHVHLENNVLFPRALQADPSPGDARGEGRHA